MMPESESAKSPDPVVLSKPAASSEAEHLRRAQAKAGELNHELDEMPSRKLYRPTRKQAGVSFSGLLLLVLTILNFAVRSSHHHPADTAYLDCIAVAQSDSTIPSNTGFGPPDDPAGSAAAAAQNDIPTPDPGLALVQAESACNKYPH
jgi:hypothetical protein